MNKNITHQPLIKIENLNIAFKSQDKLIEVVHDANLIIYPGESIAIVGESGSGKTTLSSAITHLLPNGGYITGGRIYFEGQDITYANEKEMSKIRGKQIAIIPQDPMTNLNPVLSIGFQVKEAVKANNIMKRSKIYNLALELLKKAGIKDPEKNMKNYPHEFSGGMKQRTLIAMALAGNPKLIIADEPTSALDVTVQKRILDNLADITKNMGTAILFITHDLGLAAKRAKYLVVMKEGRIVESGLTEDLLNNPRHPYTKKLISVAPSIYSKNIKLIPSEKELIKIENLTKEFKLRNSKKNKKFLALDNVNFSINKASTTALVGESGSGKSTIANIILNLLNPTSGKIYLNGVDLSKLNNKDLFKLRRRMQVVFQNPYGSLNPMYSIYKSIEEPLVIHKIGKKKEREERVKALLELVALPISIMYRFPNELSGGQRQRVAIARALALNPDVIVLDEAVSALDVLVQDQILKLLTKLQEEFKLTYLFITHDLAVVKKIADKVIVLKNGKIVEEGQVEKIFESPKNIYTQELINSIPTI